MIDDSRMFREQFREALKERFQVANMEEAGDLVEGWRKFHSLSPRLVILDINLPDGSGLYFADRIRREKRDTTVAFCTMYDVPEYRTVASRLGISHFLIKDHLDWGEIGELVSLGVEQSADALRS